MSRKIIFALLSMALTLVFGACSDGTIFPDQPQQPVVNRQSSDIIGGYTFDGLPAAGVLVYDGNAHCSGTLVGPHTVVTAGHCVSGFSASRMQFIIGPSISQAQEVINAQSILAHPGYNAQSITNDIGLVTLARDSAIEPMGILRHMDSSWVGQDLFFVGYGVDNGYQQTGAGVKRAVWMSISNVMDSQFRYEDKNKNTCNGDSGGPAFFKDADGNYLLAGVTSYGDYYCASYGVDTRVDAYLDFIGIDDQPPVDSDPCNGESFEGRCDGNTVIWCENDQVHNEDCVSEGKVCVFDDSKQYFACREQPADQPPVNDDPCNGETFNGRCDGNTVIWCENEKVNSINCSSHGSQCGLNSQQTYYDCI